MFQLMFIIFGGKSMHLDELLARNGIKFGIYKNGHFREQLFPFEAIPRIITKDDVAYLQAGPIQRVKALNAFLKDAYNDYSIVKDGNILEDSVFSSSGFLPQLIGILPPGGIYAHIAGMYWKITCASPPVPLTI